MRKIIGGLLFITDLISLPLILIYYILMSADLLYACVQYKDCSVRGEFMDFNNRFVSDITYRISGHIDLIIGA